MQTEISTNGLLAGVALAGKCMFDLGTIDSTKPDIKFRRATIGEPGRRLIAWKVRTDRALSAIDRRRVDAMRFRLLADQWKRETAFTSSTEDVVLNDAYQRILAMGPDAIPLILSELVAEGDKPHYWHWALERLAGENPTTPDMQGSSRVLRDAWLAWAKNNGFAT